MTRVDIQVEGMKCGGCESIIEKKLSEITGVSLVKADRVARRVEIEFDDNLVQPNELAKIIREQGYLINE